MNVVTKDATVTTVESDNPNGEFDVILSTDDLDRDNERLHTSEWKTPLPERITFDSDHGMSVATTVGSGRPFINEKGQLQVRGTFASTPHAQTVRTLVNEGHIDKTSVSFSVHKTQKSGKVERELLNGAFVAIPANDKAVVLSSKDAVATIKAAAGGTQDAQGSSESNPTMQDLLQAIHDAAFHLGAMCDGEITDTDTGASSGANKSLETPSAKAGQPQEDSEPAEAATEDTDTKSLSEVPAEAAEPSAAAASAKARAFLVRMSSERNSRA